ncbi:MAG: class I SAM-dependent methyltransferase [Chlamydiota bacterium]
MGTAEMHPTRCAICRTEGGTIELYPANCDFSSFTPAVFSARRMPDGIHYRMARCNRCGLVRADPAAEPGSLAHLYARSAFTYGDEVADLRHTYGRALSGLDAWGARKGDLLEIGCGNGFFLEEALVRGYARVRGVEPGSDVVARANPRVRPSIVCEVMRSGLFAPGTFDVICMFQVLDHIPDPAALLVECLAALRPGGLVLCVTHNVGSLSARLLGERSPIVDIEHTYLYSPSTLSRLFADCGFEVLTVGAIRNRYSLRYLSHLAPLPRALKQILLAAAGRTPLGRIRLDLPLGNMALVARNAHMGPT